MAGAKEKRSEASTSSGGDGRGESVIIDYGRRRSTCGYCKSGSRTSITHGLWANSLTVYHYQALLDRGWRRSGCYLYKPEMEKTCCPSYTIRLETSDFVPSKEQVRVSKRMQRFLDGTLNLKKTDKLTGEPSTSRGTCSDANTCPISSAVMDISVSGCKDKDKIDHFIHSLSHQMNQLVELCLKSGDLPSDIQLPKASIQKVVAAKRKKLQAEVSEDLIYSCNIAFQIAATMQRIKKNIKHFVRGNGDLVEISPENIAEILLSHSTLEEQCGFSIRVCNGHINFYSSTKQGQLGEEIGGKLLKSSTIPNSSSKENCSKKRREGNQGQKQKLEIRLKKSSFDDEEYALYRKYQIQVHNDTPDHVTESSYRKFLVDSPLLHTSPTDGVAIPPCGFGSFHQQYVVDRKIIAVGVIDILPKCLSSKYLFWDPDFAFLSLGKYSALQEIRWVSENQVHCHSLQYYYLGYYIHSCSKMRYKAAYGPSELLCPLRYQWAPYDIAKPLLDRQKYVVLSDITALQNGDSLPQNITDIDMEEQQNESNDVFVNDDDMSELEYEDSDDESDSEASDATIMEPDNADLNNVLIGLQGTHLRYKDIRHAFDSGQRKLFESQLKRYTRIVGDELSVQMVYSL